mgnify:CR=1 FL=1
MTADEELNLLEDNLRKLKIEYDSYFGGGTKQPPGDTEWRVRSLLKKYSDGRNLTFAQQFRYNSIAQKYAIFNDLWRRKLKIKEEGYRRPQDALLAIQGLRPDEEHAAAQALGDTGKHGSRSVQQPFAVQLSNPASELDKAQVLFTVLQEARQRAGVQSRGDFDSFQEFLTRKTKEIRSQFACASVEYAVVTEKGEVKLRAQAK